MAALVLPTSPKDKSYLFRVELEGVNYAFRFFWNTREGAWYFDITDDADVAIVAGQKVTVDWPLLDNVVTSRRPPGDVVALDTTGNGVEPARDDLGARVLLLYNESIAG